MSKKYSLYFSKCKKKFSLHLKCEKLRFCKVFQSAKNFLRQMLHKNTKDDCG